MHPIYQRHEYNSIVETKYSINTADTYAKWSEGSKLDCITELTNSQMQHKHEPNTTNHKTVK